MSQSGEHMMITEEPPPAPAPRTRRQVLLGRALRIVDAGPQPLFRAALASLTATCLLAIAIALEIRPAGPLPEAQRDEIIISLAALGMVGVIALVTVLVPAPVRGALADRYVAPAQRAGIWLALTLWFPLLCAVAYYRAKAALPLTQVWINFGYTDKRWLTAAYLISALAPMVLLVGATRVLEAGRAQPATWRAWLRDLAPRRRPGTVTASAVAAETGTDIRAGESAAGDEGPTSALPRRRGSGLRITAGLLTALGLAYYFSGPPWYLNRVAGSNSLLYQEDVYLTGFQAISKGAVPYIGPAAIQYGPGSQWFAYEYMRHFAPFSAVGFRESWAMFEWVGVSILFVVFFLALGYVRGLFAVLLSALIYPAMHQLEFVPGAAYSGLFAWASPLRYAGAISLLLLLPAAIRRAPAWRGLAGAFVLGLLWGLLSYVAQENLAAGAVGALVLAVLLLFSGTAAVRSVVTSLVAVLGGFIVSWLPVVVFYAGKGLLGRFLYLYFLDPRAVAEGYSNTPWGGVHPTLGEALLDAPWAHMYYALPFVLAVLALLAVVKFGPFRVATEWSKDRIMLVSCLVTTILLYQGAMLRADADHLTGTMFAVPVLVVAVATVLPRLLGGRQLLTVGLAGVLIFATSFLLLPVKSYEFSSIGGQAAAPILDRQRLAAERVRPAPLTVADQRVGPGLWNRWNCCQTVRTPMRILVGLANHLHAIIGNRVTYVENFMAGYPGAIYFVADLRPAPTPLDLGTMVFTKQQEASYLATFRTSVLPETQALVTDTPHTVQVRDFERRYPDYQLVELHWVHQRGHPYLYWVLLSTPDRFGVVAARWPARSQQS
jgi:hypothetical protein